jgi:hypothetical protein
MERHDSPVPTDAWIDLLFSTDITTISTATVTTSSTTPVTTATAAPPVDLRTAAYRLVDLGLRASGGEEECRTRIIARFASIWLRQLIRGARSVPALPPLPPLDPQEQTRKREAATALFQKWQRDDQFRYRRRA